MQKTERIVAAVCALILVIVAWQSVFPAKYVPRPPEPPAPELDCIGEPINVDFAYTGGVNDPWTCKVQCDDDNPRYILYSNGKATQCETPPGCNDVGEDRGVTCKLQNVSSKM